MKKTLGLLIAILFFCSIIVIVYSLRTAETAEAQHTRAVITVTRSISTHTDSLLQEINNQENFLELQKQNIRDLNEEFEKKLQQAERERKQLQYSNNYLKKRADSLTNILRQLDVDHINDRLQKYD